MGRLANLAGTDDKSLRYIVPLHFVSLPPEVAPTATGEIHAEEADAQPKADQCAGG